MNNNENCIDEYIKEKPKTIQPLLNQVRDAIRKAIPDAKEKISWKMPTYYDKHNIIHFASFKNHIGLYPGPEAIIYFKEELKTFKTSKGAIQFPYNQPLPLELIIKITKWCYETDNHH